jgi:hypothetical protein
VRVAGRDGESVTEIVPHQLPMPSNVLVGTDAENLYVMDAPKGPTGVGTMSRVASSGGAVTPIVCDLNPVENRFVDGFQRLQTEYEVTIGATDVFWVEKRGLDSPKWFIRRAAK